jgi:hypothetical protein
MLYYTSQPYDTMSSLLHHCRLPSQETPSVTSQLALEPRYIASGRPWKKTPFSNDSSIFIEVRLPHRCIQNGSSSIVTCMFLSEGTCLPSRCLAMNIYSGCAIRAFRRHATIYLEVWELPTLKQLWQDRYSCLATASKQRLLSKSTCLVTFASMWAVPTEGSKISGLGFRDHLP